MFCSKLTKLTISSRPWNIFISFVSIKNINQHYNSEYLHTQIGRFFFFFSAFKVASWIEEDTTNLWSLAWIQRHHQKHQQQQQPHPHPHPRSMDSAQSEREIERGSNGKVSKLYPAIVHFLNYYDSLILRLFFKITTTTNHCRRYT